MYLEFECAFFGSPAIEYPAILENDGLVKCQRCKTVICTLGEFRRKGQWQPPRFRSDASGEAFKGSS
jgi:hypothetical protein